MAVDLLDAPIRVSWDVCADSNPLTAEQLAMIAQQLLDAGVFFVTLEADPLLHPEIIPLLEQLANGCQVALVLRGEESELRLLDSIPPAVKLFLDVSSAVEEQVLYGDRLQPALGRIRSAGWEPSLLWMPRRGQLPVLLSILDFCVAESIRGFKLPNQKIGASCGPKVAEQLPDCNDLEQLAAVIRQVGVPQIDDLQFEVHDLFLWELLQPLSGGQRSEYGGCQAANSLGHVAADGQLWPCSSWPDPLGSLLTNSLYDLWQTEQRLEIRQQIADVPAGCDDCRDYAICFGGCRGLSSFCRDDQLKRDLLCTGIR